ncbi:hypothetical protein K432DRAFT_382336 [Lepidopterella palustris CBS 459.81]|uniref:MARVEL domain-containing protein n=1 Tax=Lepidopterella palustris CBS 459.81 TaxID=1314670 RepID=A0A8E2EAE8_9PEZI|nr:hypothetical protein K432DRAFT_382336 [Lepidopterella palustris CBS 459.81]
MVAKVVNLALRGFEFFCALIVMALIGNMIATAYSGNPSVVNYDMFVSVFGMLSLFYLFAGAFNEDFSIPIVSIALDVLNTLFFLCAGIATAAYLGVHSCGNSAYTHSNSITNGSRDTEKRCREAQASTAFLWFGFAAFAISAVFSFTGHSSSVNMRGGLRRGPAMSQV